MNNPNLKPDSDPNPNIQQQQSNDNINSITLDSLSYSCSLNDNNKFDDVFFDNNKFLIFQSPAVELESIDINDSNNNNFNPTELEFDIDNLSNNFYAFQFDNTGNNLIREENSDVNNTTYIQYY